MFCPKCGKEIPEGSTFCPECGERVKPTNAVANRNEQSAIQTVAFVFMIISTVTAGFFLIPLAWMIPMTVHLYRRMEEGRKTSVGFQVCTLIFVNLISGILLLVDGAEDY